VNDLSPLKGMPLTELNLSNTRATDLSVLKGMSLKWLHIGNTKVNDLSPLKGMPLKWLHMENIQVSDLSPLKGMPLTELVLFSTKVTELTSLKGMPLQSLHIARTQVNDLSPLKDIPLISLDLGGTPVSDLSPLKGKALKKLYMADTPITDLTPLKGMPLTDLWLDVIEITDVSPLKDMPLTSLQVGYPPTVVDVSLIKDIKKIKNLKKVANEGTLLKPVLEAMVAMNWVAAEQECNQIIADYQDVPAMTNVIQIASLCVKEGIPILRTNQKNPIWIPSQAMSFGGHHYLLWNVRMNWGIACKLCELLGGHLVTINSEDEMTFVFKLMATVKMESCYFGFKADKNGNPQWITGEPWLVKEKVATYSPAFGAIWCSNKNQWHMQTDCVRHFIIEWDR
jgi:hypothetical protein